MFSHHTPTHPTGDTASFYIVPVPSVGRLSALIIELLLCHAGCPCPLAICVLLINSSAKAALTLQHCQGRGVLFFQHHCHIIERRACCCVHKGHHLTFVTAHTHPSALSSLLLGPEPRAHLSWRGCHHLHGDPLHNVGPETRSPLGRETIELFCCSSL